MVLKVPEKNYKALRPLLSALDFNPVVNSVIDGHAPALVYANDIFIPRYAIIWNLHYMIVLVGKPNNDDFNKGISELITDKIIPAAKEKYINQFYVIYYPHSWKNILPSLLPEINMEKARRRFYSIAERKLDWRKQLPPKCRLLKIDPDVLNNKSLIYREHLIDWINSYWKSVDHFLKKGFGYCLLEGSKLVTWCLTIYASAETYEFGVVTMRGHQKRGYATLAATACLEHCEKPNYSPIWHCWDDNYPSIAVAEKIGFKMPFFYDVLRFNLNNRPYEK